MKKQLFFAISLCASCLCGAQSLNPYYYYFKGEKQYLELNPDYALVGKSNQMARSVQAEVEKVDLKNVSAADYSAKIDLLKNKEGVNFVTPYFKTADGTNVGLFNSFCVKLKSAADIEILQRYANEKGTPILKQYQNLPLWYKLSCEGTSMNALECANMFYESGLFANAKPNFASIQSEMAESIEPQTVSERAARIVNGSETTVNYYSFQWGLENTGQYSGKVGADINIPEKGWPLGYFEIYPKVAVVDNGVELNHPSFPTAAGGMDMPTGGKNIVYGNQGTSVAGIILANYTAGTRGVNPFCSFLSISSPYDESEETVTNFAAGIYAAVDAGADVINCSWSNDAPDAMIEEAVNYAETNGRGGLGAVVVFAAGNNNRSSVSFPANMDNVISVGAISSNGKRKAPTYAGEWGSNYGTGLDIVAPGEYIATTDRIGLNGNNPGGYLNDFANQSFHKFYSGTAASCAFVSGVASLMISINPMLSAKRIKQIMMNTATKLSDYSFNIDKTDSDPAGYSSALNVTWNQQVGSGLVNAYNATMKAFDHVPFIYASSVSGNRTTYSVGNFVANQSLQIKWSISSSDYTLLKMANKVIVTQKVTNAAPAILTGEIWHNGNKTSQRVYSMRAGINTSNYTPYRVIQAPGDQNLRVIKNASEENTELMATRGAVSEVTVNLYSNATLVRSEKALSTDNEISLDISGLTTGNYVLNVVAGGRMIFSQTVLIKR